MSSYDPTSYPHDNDIEMTQRGFDFSQDLSPHSNFTPNALASNGIQPSDYDFQLNSFHTVGPSSIAQFQMEFHEGLQEAEEYNGNSGLKLGYKRASVACRQCRYRKIRCIASSSDARGRCTNCVRLQKDCSSYLTNQSSAESGAPKRVARNVPITDESLSITGLSDLCFNTLQSPGASNQPLNPPEMWSTISGAPMNTGIPWTASFSTASVNNEQLSLNMRSHTLPEWEDSSLSQVLLTDAQEFDCSQGVSCLEGYSSEVSTLAPISRSPLSSALQYQGDPSATWNSDSYSIVSLPMGGSSESANINNPIIGTNEADFDVYTSVSTDQLFPPAVNYTAQGRTQSLPYAEYTSDRCME
ncbi:unnamed protein product [Fusarium fujikuroi]|uniref:Zn(2)-C6 fungal-type domain-containing protein n=1 Tax=Fusarium fujikuroi TaxID=5127 RepID=A0A9Q9UEG2_FUSFU|nr:uncharacterized protein FFE2_15952 [Fusarium fujikuroi]SCO54055.1 uncharacterized protein FFNC_15313 [Fusarium fujikuroi]VTT78178.1 unnamed protein product [Fusarium fujikuroi]VZI11104.1 unnamed protein product [Fusarium fujikuroi]